MSHANALCRDCLTEHDGAGRCPACRSPRTLAHPELSSLAIAHLDCDAFYASVEKRDNPALRDLPLIVGGGQRGVVTTCCYIARIRGVRSAMPMFKALKLCPDATVVKPRMSVYVEVSRAIRALMEDLTPLVEPLSLDEAFLDLTGTERLHGASPAMLMARLSARIEREIGVSASVGLSHNKFLAKIASDLDKPRGFSVIGRADTDAFLLKQDVSVIWGVGKAFQEKLASDGLRTIADVRRQDESDLIARYGGMGRHIWELSHGRDARRISAHGKAKSISNETTFSQDISDRTELEAYLWRMAVKVSDRAKVSGLAGRVVTLKLKRRDFKLLSRRVAMEQPIQLADTIFRQSRDLLARELGQAPFRLIGTGLSEIVPAQGSTDEADLLDPTAPARQKAERASDEIRSRFGLDAIRKGRGL